MYCCRKIFMVGARTKWHPKIVTCWFGNTASIVLQNAMSLLHTIHSTVNLTPSLMIVLSSRNWKQVDKWIFSKTHRWFQKVQIYLVGILSNILSRYRFFLEITEFLTKFQGIYSILKHWFQTCGVEDLWENAEFLYNSMEVAQKLCTPFQTLIMNSKWSERRITWDDMFWETRNFPQNFLSLEKVSIVFQKIWTFFCMSCCSKS